MNRLGFTPFKDKDVEAVFQSHPPKIRARLMVLRELIFKKAKEDPEVGKIEETLKWGQPSYLTHESKSGTTIRIDGVKAKTGTYAIYFNCKTSLIETFRVMFPQFDYEGNRAIHFRVEEKMPEKELSECITMALTYHLSKK